MIEQGELVTVGIPIHNEEQNLSALLERLLSERVVGEILAVDDWSTDRSPEILRTFQTSDPRVRAFRPVERSGQLSAWLTIARQAQTRKIVLIDGDALPERGAISILTGRLDDRVVLASGRVVAAETGGIFPAARFRSNVLHRVRALDYAKEAIIGRFFAVSRDWFLANVSRTDIIANDAYLGCVSHSEGLAAVYEPRARCLYSEATHTSDFAAQRQRADAGYAQLRSLGILKPEHEPPMGRYASAFFRELVADPLGGANWLQQQLRSKFIRAYESSGRDPGSWETQPTTKRTLR